MAFITGVALAGESQEPETTVAAIIPLPEVFAAAEPDEYRGMVDAHNFWRREVGAPDLQWSPQAAAMAQRWADALQEEHCPMRHNLAPERKKIYGENVYRYWRTSAYDPWARDAKYVTDAWGAESLWFDGADNECHAPEGGTCGHYTQVVWANSRYVGCGRAHCGDAEVWVCEYFPRGNFIGLRPYPSRAAETQLATEQPPANDDAGVVTPAAMTADTAPGAIPVSASMDATAAPSPEAEAALAAPPAPPPAHGDAAVIAPAAAAEVTPAVADAPLAPATGGQGTR